eukprot:c20196_g1_i1.p1 GENE.c20196_g1_i1~~c20196_g1_i1.p1  ORF type:complete len:370 (+),score=129.31 c20196_g1_i1:475-1584(+)
MCLICWSNLFFLGCLIFCVGGSPIVNTMMPEPNSTEKIGQLIPTSNPIELNPIQMNPAQAQISPTIQMNPLPSNFTKKLLPTDKEFKVLIAVVSAPLHEDARVSIRKSWANLPQHHSKKIDVRFFVGEISDSVERKSEIDLLLKNSSDVIRLNSFIENYHNLTKKAKAIYKWAYSNNYSAVMKVDDDSYVNIDNLWNYIEQHSDIIDNIYAGHINRAEWGECHVHTNPSSKWYMYDQYPHQNFPNYADGPGFLIGTRAIQFIAQHSDELFEYRCDDAAVGIWTDELNLEKIDMKCSIYEPKCSNSDIFVNPLSANEMGQIIDPINMCIPEKSLQICVERPCLCKGHPDRGKCLQEIIDQPYHDIIPRLH